MKNLLNGLGNPPTKHLDVITLLRNNGVMTLEKRVTVYFDPTIHRALRMLAAESDRSVSEIVNEAVQQLLVQGQTGDNFATDAVTQPAIAYSNFVHALREQSMQYAALAELTLTEVLENAVRDVLENKSLDQTVRAQRWPTFGDGGTFEYVDLEDTSSLMDWMDGFHDSA